MISILYAAISKFLMYGISGFLPQSQPREMPTYHNSNEDIKNIIDKVLSSVESESLDYSDPVRVLTPFQIHVSTHSNGILHNRSEFVECILASLDSVCKEIAEIVPDSSVSSSLGDFDSSDQGTIIGYIKWDIDTVSALVYPICMDLLRDGFVYRPDTGSFVITTRMRT